MKQQPTRTATFRRALRAWQATAQTKAPAPHNLLDLAAAACRELEDTATIAQQNAAARARAALSAIAAGRLDEASTILQRMLKAAE